MTLISFSIKSLNVNCKGGRLILKKQSVSHMVKLQEAFHLCDIWRIRNPDKNPPLSSKNIFLELFNEDSTTYLFKQSSRNNFKRRYFEFIFNKPFPSFLLLYKMFKLYERPGLQEI